MRTNSLINTAPSVQKTIYKDIIDVVINIFAVALFSICCAYAVTYKNDLLKKIIFISGIFIAVSIICIQSSRDRFLAPALKLLIHSSFLQRQVRYAVHPLADPKKNQQMNSIAYPEDSVKNALSCEAQALEHVTYVARDQEQLPGWWQFQGKELPTVICFHPNMNVQSDLAPTWGRNFIDAGFNVFLAEFRGYGKSVGKAGQREQELQTYLDAEAALKFVLDRGCDRNKIIAFGSSLGGAYATALGYFFDIGTVILDHTFTNPAALVSKRYKVVSEKTCTEILTQSYTQGSILADPTIGRRDLVTDQFNSLEKVRNATKSAFFVIQGRKDHLMPLSFGEQLVAARYPDKETRRQHLALIEGGHDAGLFFTNSGPIALEAHKKLLDFLVRQKHITPEKANSLYNYRLLNQPIENEGLTPYSIKD